METAYIRTGWLKAMTPISQNSGSTPQKLQPHSSPQSTVDTCRAHVGQANSNDPLVNPQHQDETVLLFLDLMYKIRSSLRSNTYSMSFPREAEQCDTPITGAHPLIPLLGNGNHLSSLPFCPNLPDIKEVCNVQSLQHLGVNPIHTGALPLLSFLTYKRPLPWI